MARRDHRRITSDTLPLYLTRVGGDDLVAVRRRTAPDNCVHIIPIVVLLSLFTLWWFCYPVNLEVNDGRVTVIPKMEKPISVDEPRVDIAFLAAATTPYASIPHMQKVDNQTAAETASKRD